MMTDLDEIVDKLDQWTEGKGVILYGADGNFCSGGDLNFAKQINNPELGYAMAVYMNHVLEKFKNLLMITVAYIEGTGNVILNVLMIVKRSKRVMYIPTMVRKWF